MIPQFSFFLCLVPSISNPIQILHFEEMTKNVYVWSRTDKYIDFVLAIWLSLQLLFTARSQFISQTTRTIFRENEWILSAWGRGGGVRTFINVHLLLVRVYSKIFDGNFYSSNVEQWLLKCRTCNSINNAAAATTTTKVSKIDGRWMKNLMKWLSVQSFMHIFIRIIQFKSKSSTEVLPFPLKNEMAGKLYTVSPINRKMPPRRFVCQLFSTFKSHEKNHFRSDYYALFAQSCGKVMGKLITMARERTINLINDIYIQFIHSQNCANHSKCWWNGKFW